MGQDLRNDLEFLNAGDHLELAAAADTGVDLDAKHALVKLPFQQGRSPASAAARPALSTTTVTTKVTRGVAGLSVAATPQAC